MAVEADNALLHQGRSVESVPAISSVLGKHGVRVVWTPTRRGRLGLNALLPAERDAECRASGSVWSRRALLAGNDTRHRAATRTES